MALDKVQTKTGERCRVYHQRRRRERTFKDRGAWREKRGKRTRAAACVCVRARAVHDNLHGGERGRWKPREKSDGRAGGSADGTGGDGCEVTKQGEQNAW